MMTTMFRQNLVEALVGLIVLTAAAIAVVFFYRQTSSGIGSDTYRVSALFQNATGVNVGTDVRVSGLTVGKVTDQSLEMEFPFNARVEMAIDERYKLPADSSAAITSEGLLGGTYVALTPGGDPEALRDGDQIMNTQDSVDMLSLIGQYINNSGGPAEGPTQGSAEEEPNFGGLE